MQDAARRAEIRGGFDSCQSRTSELQDALLHLQSKLEATSSAPAEESLPLDQEYDHHELEPEQNEAPSPLTHDDDRDDLGALQQQQPAVDEEESLTPLHAAQRALRVQGETNVRRRELDDDFRGDAATPPIAKLKGACITAYFFDIARACAILSPGLQQ